MKSEYTFSVVRHKDSWCIQSLLWIHPKLHHVQHHLNSNSVFNETMQIKDIRIHVRLFYFFFKFAEYLYVPLCLHKTSHDSQSSEKLGLQSLGWRSSEECSHYGVVGPFSPTNTVDMIRVQREVCSSILWGVKNQTDTLWAHMHHSCSLLQCHYTKQLSNQW